MASEDWDPTWDPDFNRDFLPSSWQPPKPFGNGSGMLPEQLPETVQFSEERVGNRFIVVETFQEVYNGLIEWRGCVRLANREGTIGRMLWSTGQSRVEARTLLLERMIKEGYGR